MNTRRRTLVALSATLSLPRLVLAQPKKPPVVIGWLSSGSSGTRGFAAFTEALAALGWKDGSEAVIERRWADGRSERLQALAEEIAALKPAVILAATSGSAAAAAKAAPATPIVVVGVDPVLGGLTASHARPGGMITGFSTATGEISYSADGLTIIRRAAHYVDRILRGTKPADMPIRQPTKFELAVNLKTAKALGVKIPPEIMVRADKVFE